ncbi:hypothetical protein BC833DRAFT_600136 [Globomyces pollinis-pini]|nr:hypothetical protein BC833DRAFT_600136 [Globomyces pollinis-pini]
MPYKTKFLSCYVDQYLHLGSSSTSRIEGNHDVLKTYLQSGNLDLITVFERLGNILDNQKVEVHKENEVLLELQTHYF